MLICHNYSPLWQVSVLGINHNSLSVLGLSHSLLREFRLEITLQKYDKNHGQIIAFIAQCLILCRIK